MEIKARGLTFDVYEGGPADGDPVLLLHGFPQDHREFDLILPRLPAAGLRTYALDHRGDSPRPRPACPRPPTTSPNIRPARAPTRSPPTASPNRSRTPSPCSTPSASNRRT